MGEGNQKHTKNGMRTHMPHKTLIKAPLGFEPGMEELQSSALPLGYGATPNPKIPITISQQHKLVNPAIKAQHVNLI